MPNAGYSTSKKSPSKKATSPARTGNSAAGKKLGSLSSFQARLNFSVVPSKPQNVPNADEDRKRMPPPAASASINKPTQNGSTSRSTNGPPTSSSSGRPLNPDRLTSKKGKEKADVAVDQGDDDDFVVTGSSKKRPLPEDRDTDADGMWTDIYAPTVETDLAPGKGRIAKVKDWLCEALYGHSYNVHTGGEIQGKDKARLARPDAIRKYRRILYISGPAGIGKTTTLKVVAKDLGVDSIEWDESIEERGLGDGFDRESSMSKLNSFLSRNSYPSLSLTMQNQQAAKKREKPRILLLTSLPNISHLPTRKAFHEALLRFCTTWNEHSCPLVIVHSSAGSGGRAEESWMDRDRSDRQGAAEIVGQEVRDSPYFREIDFLPLAQTFLNKALHRVVGLAIPDQGQCPPIAAIQLIALTCNGDLRSAINSTQLLCTSSLAEKTKATKAMRVGDVGKKSATLRKKPKGKMNLGKDMRALLEVLSRREQSLHLFHALGRVFYNKRINDPGLKEEEGEAYAAIAALPGQDPFPDHLSEFERSRSMVQMETFLPTIPIDASSYALWLHQSILSFCSDIDQAGRALDELCSADIMKTDDDMWQSSPQAISYALHITIRGSLMALPSPVPRNHQKITKPQFFESHRIEKDNLALLDIGAAYLAKKGIAASNRTAVSANDESPEAPSYAWGGTLSRATLSTEVLPMMLKIQQVSNRPLLPSTMKPWTLTPFHTTRMTHRELDVKDDLAEEDEMLVYQDAELDLHDTSAWVEEEVGEVAEENALEGDDIEDWD